ncbi:hypothetical protein ACFVDH_38745, partial [Streptomyces sp. NPDC057674]
HELRTSVDRAFGTTTCAHGAPGAGQGQGPGYGPGPVPGNPYAGGAPGPHQPPHGGGGGNPYGGGSGGFGGPGRLPPQFGGGAPQAPKPRGFLAGCAMFTWLFCTCQICCAKEYEGPWSRKKREGCCRDCDCDPGCGNCDCCCPCDGC